MSKTCVFYFNPTCELAVANGSFSYNPPQLLQEMELNLASLPFVFASANDYVLCENIPSDNYIQTLISLGFDVPMFRTLNELEAMPSGSFDAICPWGWSPAAHFKLKNLKEKCSEKFKLNPSFSWKHGHQTLFERSTSLTLLIEILDKYAQPWFIPKSLTGIPVSGIEEIEKLIQMHDSVVLKAPLSSSGRGIQIIRRNTLNHSNIAWIAGILKHQHYLILEPYLEKLADLSFQFRIHENAGVEFLGLTCFETNSNGKYKGSLINPEIHDILPGKFVFDLEDKLNKTAHILGEALKTSAYAVLHRGYLGVDAMIFRNGSQIAIQPCIEVNCRMNMGILNLFLQKQIQKGVKGKFELYYNKKVDFRQFAEREQELNPQIIRDGMISSGFFPLVEPFDQQKFGAYFSVEGTR
jgi:hypothetical protein